MDGARPGTLVPPPLPYLGAVLAGWWLDRHEVALALHLGPLRWAVAAVAMAAGIGLMAWAAATMVRWRTTINPYGVVTSLCRGGPFAHSRNPIYVGDWLMLAGASTAMDSLWPLLFSPLVWLIIRHGVIRHEEAHLQARFGEDYRRYCRQVRRWL